MDELRASLGHAGSVRFRSAPEGGLSIEIHNVCVQGMKDGLHGFHVHERGDTSKGCASMGPHYDPRGAHRHGGPDDVHRHLGDLGNVRSEGGCLHDGVLHASDLTLDDVRGRGIVLHEREDDFGRGRTEESHTTGSAGARIACGRISV